MTCFVNNNNGPNETLFDGLPSSGVPLTKELAVLMLTLDPRTLLKNKKIIVKHPWWIGLICPRPIRFTLGNPLPKE
jgi:hypothetical protein